MTDHINCAQGDLAKHHERMLRERIAELEATLAANEHAKKFWEEYWGLFCPDCGPSDYEFMLNHAIATSDMLRDARTSVDHKYGTISGLESRIRVMQKTIDEQDALIKAKDQHIASLAKEVKRKQQLLEEATAQVDRLENALLGIKRPTETLDERGTHDDHSTD